MACLVIEVDGSFLRVSGIVNCLVNILGIWRYRLSGNFCLIGRVTSNDWTLDGIKRLAVGLLAINRPRIIGNNLSRNFVSRVAAFEGNRCISVISYRLISVDPIFVDVVNRFADGLLICLWAGCVSMGRTMLEVDRKLLWCLRIVVIRCIISKSILVDNIALLSQLSQCLISFGMADLFTSLASQLNRLVIQWLVVCLVIEADGSFLRVSYINNINVLTQIADVIRRVKRVVCHRLVIDRWRKAGYLWNCNITGLGWVRLIIWILSLIFSWEGLAVRTDDQIAQLFIGVLNVDRLWNVDAVNSNWFIDIIVNFLWLTWGKIKLFYCPPSSPIPTMIIMFHNNMHQAGLGISFGKGGFKPIMPIFSVDCTLLAKWRHEAMGIFWLFGKIAIDYFATLCRIDLTIQTFLNDRVTDLDWFIDLVTLAIKISNVSRRLRFYLWDHETNTAIVSIILARLRVKNVELWLPGTIRSNKDTWLTIIVNCAKISLVISSYFCWFIFINRVLT